MSRILIVDDNRELAENLQEILADEDVGADIASGGHEAVGALEKGDYSLIITDIRMPGLDGVGLLKTINERWPQLPVIAMSAYSGDAVIQEMQSEGALGVLPKPLEIATILGMVERVAEPHAPVLVVEDDRDLRVNLTEALLDIANVVPHTAPDVTTARRLLEKLHFPVVIIDVRLPDGDGLAFGRELENRGGANTTVIYITGFADEIRDSLETVLRAPHMHLLEKPFSPEVLLDLVRDAT